MQDVQPGAGFVHHIVPPGHGAELRQQLVGIAGLDQAPLFHDEHLLKHIRGFLQNVGGDNERAPGLGVIVQQQAVKILPRYHVQPGYRLIHKGDGGAAGQRQHDGQHAGHALG